MLGTIVTPRLPREMPAAKRGKTVGMRRAGSPYTSASGCRDPAARSGSEAPAPPARRAVVNVYSSSVIFPFRPVPQTVSPSFAKCRVEPTENRRRSAVRPGADFASSRTMSGPNRSPKLFARLTRGSARASLLVPICRRGFQCMTLTPRMLIDMSCIIVKHVSAGDATRPWQLPWP